MTSTLTTSDKCTERGCDRPLNRDGLCFYHKVRTIKVNAENFTRDRRGQGPGFPDSSSSEYVRDMFEKRRKAGLPDPVPENDKAAALVPPVKMDDRAAHKKRNNGAL